MAALLRVAIQMDPVETINIDGDSTFAVALEAQKRGHTLFHYTPRTLFWAEGRVLARARPAFFQRTPGNPATLGASCLLDLAQDVDVILMRQDPPFDMSYITSTHLLEQVQPHTLVVNDPASVRNAPEKLFALDFPDLIAPTLISADREAIRDFRARHRDIILKPLYGNGGAGVFHVKPDDENLGSLMDMFFAASREPLMVQAYLPEVRLGDKRIILIDGKPVGTINRVPLAGDARSNMHVGGRAEKANLTRRDLEICEALGPVLRDRGLIFTGIDVIGSCLTEINVTSPTGIQEIDRFNGVNLSAMLWDVIEGRC